MCRGSVGGYVVDDVAAKAGRAGVRIDFAPHDHAGVTLDHGVRTGCVVVTRLHSDDRFYKSGIRVGDTIEGVNGVRTTNASTAIRLLEASRMQRGAVCVRFGARSSRWWRRGVRLVRPWGS